MMKHTIMFPYHISRIHWGVGGLDLDLDGNGKMMDATLAIYNPLFIENKEDEEIKKQVQEEVKKTLEAEFPSNINFKAKNVQFTNQQKDGASCGVITAENGKGIIDGNLIQRLQKSYELGAIQAREQHLKEVDSEKFNVMQIENEDWKTQSVVIDETYLKKIIGELDKFGMLKNEIFYQKQGGEISQR